MQIKRFFFIICVVNTRRSTRNGLKSSFSNVVQGERERENGDRSEQDEVESTAVSGRLVKTSRVRYGGGYRNAERFSASHAGHSISREIGAG